MRLLRESEFPFAERLVGGGGGLQQQGGRLGLREWGTGGRVKFTVTRGPGPAALAFGG